MAEGTHTFWQFTINNYDATDLALLQQGYPDHIRQLVYTLEKGDKTGTPHVQAYVKLMRPQRRHFVQKLFPGGANFKYLVSDEFKLNAQRYAQKLDKTAESPAVILNNPFQDPVSELMAVTRDVYENFLPTGIHSAMVVKLKWKEIGYAWTTVERSNVSKRPSLAKFYVSAMYTKIKETYWREFLLNITDEMDRQRREELRIKIPTYTHTHTHSDEKFSRQGGITNAGTEGDDASESPNDASGEEDADAEDYEDGTCASDEEYDEGSGSDGGASDDLSSE